MAQLQGGASESRVLDEIDGLTSIKLTIARQLVSLAMASSETEFERALHRYRGDVFTDGDLTRCAGLSGRSVRELIKLGAVRTRTEERGAGRVRTFDATTFKRLAVIGAVNSAGMSLKLAGRMTYLLPSDDLLYRTYDPINVLCDTTLGVADPGELPPRLEAPKFDWFDAKKPATSDPEHDWLLEIIEGRFVALVAQGGRLRLIYGDLRKEGTEFVSWWPSHAQLDRESLTDADVSAKWEGKRLWADRIDPQFLDYRYEDHIGEDDPLMQRGYSAVWHPLVKTTINVSLAIRLALRRYLGVEPLLSDKRAISRPTAHAMSATSAWR